LFKNPCFNLYKNILVCEFHQVNFFKMSFRDLCFMAFYINLLPFLNLLAYCILDGVSVNGLPSI